MLRLPLSIIVLSVVMAVSAGARSHAGELINPESVKLPKMTPALNLGKMTYDAFCASCHGVNIAGTDKGPTFLSRFYHPGHHGDSSFYAAATKGVKAHHWKFGDMKPVEGVSKVHIKKIVQYVRSVQKANGLF